MTYADPLDADVLLADGTVAVVRGVLPGIRDVKVRLTTAAPLDAGIPRRLSRPR